MITVPGGKVFAEFGDYLEPPPSKELFATEGSWKELELHMSTVAACLQPWCVRIPHERTVEVVDRKKCVCSFELPKRKEKCLRPIKTVVHGELRNRALASRVENSMLSEPADNSIIAGLVEIQFSRTPVIRKATAHSRSVPSLKRPALA